VACYRLARRAPPRARRAGGHGLQLEGAQRGGFSRSGWRAARLTRAWRQFLQRLRPFFQVYDPKKQPDHLMGWQHERQDQPVRRRGVDWSSRTRSCGSHPACPLADAGCVDPAGALCDRGDQVRRARGVQAEQVPRRVSLAKSHHAPDRAARRFTWRFPRVQRFRFDKAWYECATITARLRAPLCFRQLVHSPPVCARMCRRFRSACWRPAGPRQARASNSSG
jgi:hypothetical protein